VLLRYLYDLAQSRSLLNDLAFAPKAIRWVIALDEAGNLLGSGPIETTGEKNRGKEFSAPQTSRPKVAGGVAEFLADGITALFGLDSDPEKDAANAKKRRERDANNAAKYKDFWQQIEQAQAATQHPALKAILQFRAQMGNSPVFLRWGISREARAGEKAAWWLAGTSGAEVKLGPENFTFDVSSQLLLDDEQTIRPYWRSMYQQEITARDSSTHPRPVPGHRGRQCADCCDARTKNQRCAQYAIVRCSNCFLR